MSNIYHKIKNTINENKEDWYYLCNDAEQALLKVRSECKDESAIKALEKMILDLNNIRMEQYEALVEYTLNEEYVGATNLDPDDMVGSLRNHFNWYEKRGYGRNKKYIDSVLRSHYANKWINDNEYKSLRKEYELDENPEANGIKADLQNLSDDPTWIIGNITINNETYRVNAKVFLEDSEYGINGGPVSKLWVSDSNKDTIINYDRGWDVEPANKELYNIILKLVQDFRKEHPYDYVEEFEDLTESEENRLPGLIVCDNCLRAIKSREDVSSSKEGLDKLDKDTFICDWCKEEYPISEYNYIEQDKPINESVKQEKCYVICYDDLEVWPNKESAKKFYEEGIYWTEGTEQLRYRCILSALNGNSNIAYDEVSDDVYSVKVRKENGDIVSNKSLETPISIDDINEYIEKLENGLNESVDEHLLSLIRKKQSLLTDDTIDDDTAYELMDRIDNELINSYSSEDIEEANKVLGLNESAGSSNFSIEYATPCYTGGGIYVYTGKLKDGNYFLGSDDWFSDKDNYFMIRIVSEDPDKFPEDCFFDDWQQKYLVKDLSLEECKKFTKQILNWIIKNKPDGNYQIDDMEKLLNIANK